ncbi:DUF6624 domain-containing protein [Terrimonas rubra]|uniref:DUF6624 domain-containing protein n=1 Tax=Terrimonas rubra TaxID=1035890 RepID=A0ABW6A406_9BACT
MQKVIFGFLMFFTSISLLGQDKISNPVLKVFIDSLYSADQAVQQNAIDAYQRTGSIDTFAVYEKIQIQTFEKHIPILKKIYSDNGYPTVDKVGKESTLHFFTLIQHADKDISFQKKMLPIIKKQVDKGQISGREYAYLYDRVQINSGKEQLYGTQLEYDTEGNAIPKNLKDKQNVDQRRAAFKMETLEKYLVKATELHKQMNRKK